MIGLLCIGFDTLCQKNNAKFVAGGRNFSPRRPVCRSVRGIRPAAEVPKGRVHAGLELDYNKLLDMVSEMGYRLYNKLLDMVSEMGYRLMESGAEIYRVEESIHRLLEAYGVPRGEVFAIPNCIIVSLISPEGRPLTQIRRMPPHGTDIYLLEKYNGLCRRLCQETPPFDQALRRMRAIARRPISWAAACFPCSTAAHGGTEYAAASAGWSSACAPP